MQKSKFFPLKCKPTRRKREEKIQWGSSRVLKASTSHTPSSSARKINKQTRALCLHGDLFYTSFDSNGGNQRQVSKRGAGQVLQANKKKEATSRKLVSIRTLVSKQKEKNPICKRGSRFLFSLREGNQLN